MFSKGIGLTDVGKERKNNEDTFCIDDELGLYIVCDGMGGHACGEVASKLALDTARSWIDQNREILNEVRDGECSPERAVEIVREAVNRACATVYKRAISDGSFAGMGTTMTILVIIDTMGIMAHVGDTRLYLLQDGSAYQLSTDHTVAAEFVRTNVMSEQDAQNSPFGNSLTRTVGLQETVLIDSLVFDISAGSRFLMCSDGFSRYLSSSSQLAELIGGLSGDISQQLIDFANNSGGRDNISVIWIETQLDEIDSAASTDEVKLLGDVFPFESLRRADIQRIRNLCETVSISAEQRVFEEEDELPGMILVTSGEFWLERGGKRVRKLGMGEAIGAGALLHNSSLDLSLEAISDAQILLLKRDALEILCDSRPWLGLIITRKLGERVCALSEEAVLAQL